MNNFLSSTENPDTCYLIPLKGIPCLQILSFSVKVVIFIFLPYSGNCCFYSLKVDQV